jgi:hypothetical protein
MLASHSLDSVPSNVLRVWKLFETLKGVRFIADIGGDSLSIMLMSSIGQAEIQYKLPDFSISVSNTC